MIIKTIVTNFTDICGEADLVIQCGTARPNNPSHGPDPAWSSQGKDGRLDLRDLLCLRLRFSFLRHSNDLITVYSYSDFNSSI